MTKFIKYSLTGAACALMNLLVLWLLTSVLGVHYLVSTMISFFTLTPVAFWLQKLVTFGTPRARALIEWPRYFATMASSFVANIVLMYVLVSLLGLWYLAANVAVIVLLLATNFLVNDRWSFARR
ncbi:MAG TPA: GtrA family protein [Burkholderiales bacterium]|jgi:putative flippase GtrA|nr:GtrA family protein [Burkholderiales bacterium]